MTMGLGRDIGFGRRRDRKWHDGLWDRTPAARTVPRDEEGRRVVQHTITDEQARHLLETGEYVTGCMVKEGSTDGPFCASIHTQAGPAWIRVDHPRIPVRVEPERDRFDRPGGRMITRMFPDTSQPLQFILYSYWHGPIARCFLACARKTRPHLA